MQYSITKPETFKGKDNQEKTTFHSVGTVTILENPKVKVQGYVKIPLLGEFPIFLFEKKEPTGNGTQNLQQAERALNGDDTNQDLSGIPF